MAEQLRVLALSEHNDQFRVVVGTRPDNAMWVFGGHDKRKPNYVQVVTLWPEGRVLSEPTPQQVADAVAKFGRQRADDR